MIVIAASCPSNRLAAVTKRTGRVGTCSSTARLFSVGVPEYYNVQLSDGRATVLGAGLG